MEIKSTLPKLSDYFERILEAAGTDPEIGSEDRYEGWDETNFISFEEDGITIDGLYKCAGSWRTAGDGYWEPRETYLTHVSVSVVEVTAYYTDPETGEETEYPEDEVNALYEYLEKELPDFIKD